MFLFIKNFFWIIILVGLFITIVGYYEWEIKKLNEPKTVYKFFQHTPEEGYKTELPYIYNKYADMFLNKPILA